MKQTHAVLRLLICLLLAIAWAKQPPPAFPGHGAGASSVTDGHLLRHDADAVPGDVDLWSVEVTEVDRGGL